MVELYECRVCKQLRERKVGSQREVCSLCQLRRELRVKP